MDPYDSLVSPQAGQHIYASIDDVVVKDFQLSHVLMLERWEQVAYVYKWLLGYCNYHDPSPFDQFIDSVFVRRNSVCMGYSRSAQYLFDRLGVKSRLVFGRLKGSGEGSRHCWNLVTIDGKSYHLDVSLGDSALGKLLKASGAKDVIRLGAFNYACFCVSDEKIAETHIIEDGQDLPVCAESIDAESLNRLSKVRTRSRDSIFGCLLAETGSTADIRLCTRNKKIVLKVFRPDSPVRCEDEYQWMAALKGCRHLLRLDETYTNPARGVLAIEQAFPAPDVFRCLSAGETLRQALLMARDIARAWQECKEKGVLYRDIHICNVYLSDEGIFKLGDFGSCISVDADVRTGVGAREFMAPEVLGGGLFDERSAVYSITAALFSTLYGLRPVILPAEDVEKVVPSLLGRHSQDVVMGVVDLVKAGCASRPQDRILTCQALIDRILGLLAFLDGKPKAEECRRSIDEEAFSDLRYRLVSPNCSYIRLEKSTQTDFISMTLEDRCATGCISPTTFEPELPKEVESPDRSVQSEAKLQMMPDEEVIRRSQSMSILGNIVNIFGLAGGSFLKRRPTARRKPDAKSISIPQPKLQDVYSSVFAPAEVKRRSYMHVQVFLHRADEADQVADMAKEAQPGAARMGYAPLDCKLKEGDEVDVRLEIRGETLLHSETNHIVWRGAFSKCSFMYYVPRDLDVDSLCCRVMFVVNGLPQGEMRFVTEIVAVPMQLHANMRSSRYEKVFVSYAHEDEGKVKYLAEGLRASGADYFFDRHYLKIGDVYPLKIRQYIENADLFILCWSENAARSEYVRLELDCALQRVFPNIRPESAVKLAIYPLDIDPHTSLPEEVKPYYNFGSL